MDGPISSAAGGPGAEAPSAAWCPWLSCSLWSRLPPPGGTGAVSHSPS